MLDARFAQFRLCRSSPLRTHDHQGQLLLLPALPTTAGSFSLKDSMPPRDAFQVRKLREAGGNRSRQVEHGGVRRKPIRDGCARCCPAIRAIPTCSIAFPPVRAGGRRSRSPASFGARRLGDRHRQFDPWARFVPHEPRRHPFDHGVDEPRRHRAATASSRYRRPRSHGPSPMPRPFSNRYCRSRSRRSRDFIRSKVSGPDSYLTSLDKNGLKGARIGVPATAADRAIPRA